MKVLIMHLCICTARGRFRYIGDIYTIYGAFICVSRLGLVGFFKHAPQSWEAGGSSCFLACLLKYDAANPDISESVPNKKHLSLSV